MKASKAVRGHAKGPANQREKELGAPEARHEVATWPLSRIKQREHDTRKVSARHVGALADSLRAIGLIQPIAVSDDGVLLAGAHRLAAIAQLKETDPDAYERWFPRDEVPVRVIRLEDSGGGKQQALAVELSENEKRRNYTRQELMRLIERLRAAGYAEGSGRLKPGEKHMAPALSAVLGKSLRTVSRMLAEVREAPVDKPREEAMARVLGRLRRAFAAYESEVRGISDGAYVELSKAVAHANKCLNEVYALH